MRQFLVALLVVALVAAGSVSAVEAVQFVRIGTASVGGTFYPIGNAIAQLLNRELGSEGIRATASATGGSAANIISLDRRELELGIAQGATVAEALTGTGAFEGRPINTFRAITIINASVATIMVKDDPSIQSVGDLRGKRIAVGPVGGGIEVNSRKVLAAYGIGDGDFRPEHTSTGEALDMMKLGQADAMIYFTDLATATVTEVLRRGRVKLLGLEPDKIEWLLARNPELVATEIPANTYPGQLETLPSVGGVNLLLTHDGVDEELVYNITKLIFNNLEFLRERHFSFQDTSHELAIATRLLTDGGLLLHPGAERYYREVGVIQ